MFVPSCPLTGLVGSNTGCGCATHQPFQWHPGATLLRLGVLRWSLHRGSQKFDLRAGRVARDPFAPQCDALLVQAQGMERDSRVANGSRAMARMGVHAHLTGFAIVSVGAGWFVPANSPAQAQTIPCLHRGSQKFALRAGRVARDPFAPQCDALLVQAQGMERDSRVANGTRAMARMGVHAHLTGFAIISVGAVWFVAAKPDCG